MNAISNPLFDMAHGLCFKHQPEAPENLDTGPMLNILPGQAVPLGVSEVDNGINFAIFSQHATSVTICLSLNERCVSNLQYAMGLKSRS